MAPSQHFCSQCGSPLRKDVRFCTECGAPVTVPAAVQPAAKDPAGGEQITAVISGFSTTSLLGGTSYYTLLPTPARIIVARITDQMLRDQYEHAAQQAKESGSGFFGQVFAKIGTAADIWGNLRNASAVFQTMDPNAAISCNPENFAILRQDITSVTLERQDYARTVQDKSRHRTYTQHQYHYHLTLTTRNGAFAYDAPYDTTIREQILATFPGQVQESGG